MVAAVVAVAAVAVAVAAVAVVAIVVGHFAPEEGEEASHFEQDRPFC